MEYLGINIPGVMVRRKFLELMQEGGVKHINLDELLLIFTAIVISTRTKTCTGHKAQPEWMFWGEANNCALTLVPAEVRYDYVLAVLSDHDNRPV